MPLWWDAGTLADVTAWAATRREHGARGGHSANQAFKFHASPVITIYAQLLSKLSTGAVNARTPPLP